MILVDANLLIYAHVCDLPDHEASRAWLDDQLSHTARVALPWSSLLAFVRITSNAKIFRKPLHIRDAWAQVERWLAAHAVWVPEATPQHAAILARWMPEHITRPNLVPDAHLAALAVGHGLTLCSTDGDFARFPGLRWENPLRDYD